MPSRSSVTNRLAALTEIGGVNSLRSFSRSWQRAAAFAEVIPQRPTFVYAPGQEPLHTADPITYGRTDVEAGARTSLLRGQLDVSSAENAIVDGDGEEDGPAGAPLARAYSRDPHGKNPFENDLGRALSPSGSVRSNSIFEVPPHLSALVGSYSSQRTYGTMDSDTSRQSAMAHAGELWRQQQEARMDVPDGERPPIIVKEVEQDGKFVLAVSGQSTLPQTVMNSTK